MAELPSFPTALELRCGPIGAVDLALYAAASGDHNPLHLDEAVARGAGFERPVVHGMLTMACVARLFTEAFGAAALQTLHTRFTGAALRGDVLLFDATLTEAEGDEARYTLTGRTEGGQEIVTGSAQVRR